MAKKKDRIKKLIDELEDAEADEAEAASKAALIREELSDLGIDDPDSYDVEND